jgi:hypothetical protein
VELGLGGYYRCKTGTTSRTGSQSVLDCTCLPGWKLRFPENDCVNCAGSNFCDTDDSGVETQFFSATFLIFSTSGTNAITFLEDKVGILSGSGRRLLDLGRNLFSYSFTHEMECDFATAINNNDIINHYASGTTMIINQSTKLWQVSCVFWVTNSNGVLDAYAQLIAGVESLKPLYPESIVDIQRSALFTVQTFESVNVVACESGETFVGEQCVCDAGYTQKEGKCTACSSNTFKASVSNDDACTKCPSGGNVNGIPFFCFILCFRHNLIWFFWGVGQEAPRRGNPSANASTASCGTNNKRSA